MRRLKHYLKIVVWQTGLGYLLLWAVTFWALDEGATVFGKSGVCYPDEAKVLFYWVCEATSPFAILASVVNVALTATVWAPVYLAAATAQPDAAAIAVPIIALHVVGLPLGIFVLMRMMATAIDLRRRIGSGGGPAPAQVTAQVTAQATAQVMAHVTADVAAAPAAPAPPARSVAAPSVTAPSALAASMPAPAQRIVPPRPTKKIKPRSEFGLRPRGRP
jgi:hypothetical protein